MSPQPDKKEQIAAAARAAIQRDGLGSVSFRTLAEQVGVKSSSVHYHYRTKDDLAEAVIVEYIDRFAAELADIESREARLAGRLHALVDVFETVTSNEELCLCGMMAADVRGLSRPARAALQRFFDLSEQWLIRQFTELSDELASPLEPAALASVFVAGLEGAGLVDRVDRSTRRLAAFRKLIGSLIRYG